MFGSRSASRPRLDVQRPVVFEADHQWLSAIRVMQSSRTVIPRTLRRAHSNRKAGLQFAHPRLHFVSIDLLPYSRRPVLVKTMRIFKKKYIVGTKLEVATLVRSNRHRITLALQRKASQHLLHALNLR